MKKLLLSLLIIGMISSIFTMGFDTQPSVRNANYQEIQTLKTLDKNIKFAKINENTNTPHRVFCNISVPYQEDSESILHSSIEFMLDNPEFFNNTDPSGFEILGVNKKLGKWIVALQQTHNGIPVLGGRVDFRYSHNTLVMFGADIYDVSSVTTEPSVSAIEAEAIAKGSYPMQTQTSSLAIVNTPEGFRLAWNISGNSSTPVSQWRVLVDAENGSIIDSYDNIRYLVEGTVLGEYIFHTPMDDIDTTHFPHVVISCDLGYIDTADIDGNYSLPIEPSADRVIHVELAGLYADVTLPGGERGYHTSFADESPYNFVLAWDDFDYQEVNGYYHINFIHTWYKILDPDFSGLDYPVPVVVEDTVSPCPVNAFWDGTGVHMGAGGSGWDDFGLYSEIYYHEYTHGVSHNIYPGSMLPYTGQPGAMDEAFSDYFACTITGDPDVGEGGLLPGGEIMRTHDNDLVYPDDWEDEVHADGRLIGGAFWDLRESIRVTLCDTLVHFSRYGLTENFDDFAWDVLFMDDDDGNIYNGTPHIYEIYNAFNRHGIGGFETQILHEHYHDTEEMTPYELECQIITIFPLNPDMINILYRTSPYDRFASSLLYADSLEAGRYTGEIPGMEWGTTVYYYIQAYDTIGNFDILPEDAPEELFSFYVGADTLTPDISHDPITDQPVERHPYLVDCHVNDNYGVDSVYVHFAKNDGSFSTLPLDLVEGDYYRNSIDVGDVEVGDYIDYYLEANDLAGVSNVSRYPETGYIRFYIVNGYFITFEDDDAGFEATSGWEWGTPTAGPEYSYSGDNCWGTVLDGNYTNRCDYRMATPEFDVSDFSSLALEFRHWYNIEIGYDGGMVEIKTDDGPWTYISPVDGYDRTVSALDDRGFTGSSDGWELVKFNLTNYHGENVSFRFTFASDAGVVGPGWYIDNIAILDKQIVEPPYSIHAESGHDARVPLSWYSPYEDAFARELEETEFEGFNIYRTTDPSSWDATPLASVDEYTTEYEDTDVTNGTTYHYRVTAVYDRGESQPTEVASAMPFNAEISILPDSFFVIMYEDETKDTIMTISNTGSGMLDFHISEQSTEPGTFLHYGYGDMSSANLENVARAIEYYSTRITTPDRTVDPEGEWTQLATDPSEPGITLDLAAMYGQTSPDDIYLRVTSHAPMGNPLEDYAIAFMLDTDQNPETGMPEGGGTDYLVAFGSLPMGNSMILRYNPSSSMGFDYIGTPHYVNYDEEGTFIEVGFSRSDIEDPRAINLLAMVSADLMTGDPEDIVPDGTVAWSLENLEWFDYTPAMSTIEVSSPVDINLTFNSTDIEPGEYKLWMRIESNDREMPLAFVPVEMIVWGEAIMENNAPQAFTMNDVYPNPFNPACDVEFEITGNTDMTFEIHDIMGNRVFFKEYADMPTGNHRFTWNGFTDDGLQAPSGVYLFTIRTGKETTTRRAILVR